jgi:PAS domain S-box-containing protein
MLRDNEAGLIAGEVGEYLQLGPRVEKKRIKITEDIELSWQSMVDTLAELCHVPAALIMRVDRKNIKVLSSSRSQGNVYEAGSSRPVDGRYCEEVIKTKHKLLVPNALNDKAWNKNPDIELGMISYFGFPLLWPDGEIFGTICIMDSKENRYGKRVQELMLKFKEHLETHLKFRHKAFIDRMSLKYILDNIGDGIIAHDMNRRILFFNNSAEKITGFKKEEVLGKDCHVVFGEPFCGEQCSFCGNVRGIAGKTQYSLNITTKDGESRKIEMTASMMKDEKDREVGVLTAFKDVTQVIDLQIQSGELFRFGNIIGKDKKMLDVFQQIRDITDYNFPVHIAGETGTGKELVAHAIHNESRRKGAPFVPINCGALPEGLIESELFGHVKGAFSGAIREKKGRFELANGGTVFLDEIAELPKLLQVKLLRFLQEGCFEKVGGEKTISIDVRVISATNKNLKQEVANGNFREDLYYRLKVIPIHIPPLRERKTDIPLLIQHFLHEFSREAHKLLASISDNAMASMMDYAWPGNVRELQNAIQFSIVRSRGKTITLNDLPRELKVFKVNRPRRGPARKLQVAMVKDALQKNRWEQS